MFFYFVTFSFGPFIDSNINVEMIFIFDSFWIRVGTVDIYRWEIKLIDWNEASTCDILEKPKKSMDAIDRNIILIYRIFWSSPL
jgi:hypothetical protein